MGLNTFNNLWICAKNDEGAKLLAHFNNLLEEEGDDWVEFRGYDTTTETLDNEFIGLEYDEDATDYVPEKFIRLAYYTKGVENQKAFLQVLSEIKDLEITFNYENETDEIQGTYQDGKFTEEELTDDNVMYKHTSGAYSSTYRYYKCPFKSYNGEPFTVVSFEDAKAEMEQDMAEIKAEREALREKKEEKTFLETLEELEALLVEVA